MSSIFITGAASGIGKATAIYFHNKGWFVGLADRDQDGLKRLQEELGQQRCCPLVMDVTKVETIETAFETFKESGGGTLDILFNCAGILYMGKHESISLEEQQRIINVNVTGVLNCIHAALPFLKATPGARIISMSSASAVYGIPQLAVYSASKHAIRGLTEALNIEFAEFDVHVSDIMVPYVNTPMLNKAEHKAASIKKIGVGISSEQVADAVWHAGLGKRVHWRVSVSMYMFSFVNWAFPFARRSLIKLTAS